MRFSAVGHGGKEPLQVLARFTQTLEAREKSAVQKVVDPQSFPDRGLGLLAGMEFYQKTGPWAETRPAIFPYIRNPFAS